MVLDRISDIISHCQILFQLTFKQWKYGGEWNPPSPLPISRGFLRPFRANVKQGSTQSNSDQALDKILHEVQSLSVLMEKLEHPPPSAQAHPPLQIPSQSVQYLAVQLSQLSQMTRKFLTLIFRAGIHSGHL